MNIAALNKYESTASLWLKEVKKITRKMTELGLSVSVKVCSEKWQNRKDLEYRGIVPSRSKYFIREVLIKGDQIPMIIGRVMIPDITYEHMGSAIENLGDKPIGEAILYNNSDYMRSDFTYFTVKKSSLLTFKNELIDINASHFMGRYSRFYTKDQELVIEDIALPGLPYFKHD